jgi:peroxiredoxin
MPALPAGKAAPNFTLSTSDGKSFNLKDVLTRGPVVLVFFKVSCPTCHYSLPFYERLFKTYKNRPVMLGISQNDAKDTTAFAREFGITFPLLLDDTRNYPVSHAYGLTNVPTIFWIDSDGVVQASSVGWSKPDFDQINRRIAEVGHIPPALIFQPGDDVLEYRAG